MIRTDNRFRIRYQKIVVKPATATLTSIELGKGIIKTTSAAATTLTLPTATLIGRHLKASAGDKYEFTVDNSAGASVVTLALGTGIIVPATVVITGSNVLTTAVGLVSLWTLYFKSPTTATLFRTS